MLASGKKPQESGTLFTRLKQRIANDGPLTIAAYMEACLSDPDSGYYATRDPFGAAGDFTTAPEISQIFGELIGLWAAVVWQQMGKPAPVRLTELGPGRGTLMADALRAAARVPDFLQAAGVHLVETSPVLRDMQGETLTPYGVKPQWHIRLDDVPEGAAILIANEFLDALPVRQFQHRKGEWFERCVGISDDGKLEFLLAPAAPDTPELLPQFLRETAKDGDMAEIRPAADEIVEIIASRAKAAPTAALFFDYGHEKSAPGETLQALQDHDYAAPLARPGEADLTAHVDFGQLAETARRNGLHVHGPCTQAAFLLALGLSERTGRLMENASKEKQDEIASGTRRLADPAQMGELFKVIALTSLGLEPPPFSAVASAEQNT